MGWAELEKLLARIEERVSVEADSEEPERECPLPWGHSCGHGWHWRPGNGTTPVAYMRCPLHEGSARQAQAAESYGGQTFASFERRREPEAYRSVREWAGDCRRVTSKLALIPQPNQPTTGCGKTHLLRAAAHELALHGLNPGWIGSGALSRVVRSRAAYAASARGEGESEARGWATCTALFIDGLGFEDASGGATAAFLIDLLDEREGKTLAVATSWDEQRLLAHYGSPLVSRLVGGARRPALIGLDYRRRDAEQGGTGS